MSGSARRLRRSLAACALMAPLLALPAGLTVSAAADTPMTGHTPATVATGALWGSGEDDWSGPWSGSWSGSAASGEPSYGGSSPWWGERGDLGYGDTTTSPAQTTQDASAATNEQSAGVVLIDTVVDYGQEEAAGTGMVLSSDGVVVTNHHVVAGATSITVTVPSTGKTYRASVLGYDTTHDVAVLQLRGASGLTSVTTDPTARVGEAVSAVGNAEGANRLTAAAGRILKRRTSIDVTEDDGSTAHLTGLIEDSSDVVSGDSGGALMDADDEVVGMTVAASSGTTDVTGYAIPIQRVLTIEHDILAGDASGSVTIGTKAALGIAVDSRTSAPYVTEVMSASAAHAGLTAGDTITAVDGTTVSSYDELRSVLARLDPGQTVRVTWTDSSGAVHHASITLGTAPIG